MKRLAIIIILLAALLLSVSRLVEAEPFTVAPKLVLPDGTPLANTVVRIVVFNVTSNRPLVAFLGVSDRSGRIKIPLYAFPSSGRYNVTVAFLAGRLYLGNWSLDMNPNGLNSTQLIQYLNGTVVLGRVHLVTFRAMTDLNGDGIFETPLYYAKASNFADIAYVSTSVGSSNCNSDGYTLNTFPLSDVEILMNDSGYILSITNASYAIDLYWKIYTNTTSFYLVRVGSHLLTFSYRIGTRSTFNLTDTVSSRPVTIGVASSSMRLDLHGYTFTIIVDLATFCEDTVAFKSGSYGWRLYISGPSENGTVTLRSGAPNPDGVAPASPFGAFWLPNTTAFYHQNYTLVTSYYGIVVLDEALPLNLTPPQYVFRKFYGNTTWVLAIEKKSPSFPYAYNVTARTSLVKMFIQIFDSASAPAPLEGAIVELRPAKGDPIPSATGPGGYVNLPPFVPTTSGVTESGGQLVGFTAANYPFGYMPVPYHLLLQNASYVSVWEIRIKYRIPNGNTFVDVTPKDNIIAINASSALTCQPVSKAIFAEVFDIKLLLTDACGNPLSSTAYANTSYVLYMWDGSWKEESGAPLTTTDGTLDLLLPGGTYMLKLVYKGLTLPPASGNLNFTVSSGGSKYTIGFPIGDLRIVAKMWGGEQTLYGLRVELRILKGNTTVYAENSTGLTDASGSVVFHKVPLRADGKSVIATVRAWTTNRTYFIRPQDVGLLVANYTYNLSNLPLGCSVSINLPTWIYSFRVEASDCHGDTLVTPPVTGIIPTTVYVLIDGDYGLAPLSPPETSGGQVNFTTISFRIVNSTFTGPNGTGNGLSISVWNLTSRQFDAGHPHLFVAGASYRMRIIYAGVVVFDYNVTLPVPNSNITVFINETVWNSTVMKIENFWLNSTVAYNFTFHPLFWFNGTTPFSNVLPKLKLFTWVVPVAWYSTDAFGRAFIKTKLAVVRSDIINMTVFNETLQRNWAAAYRLASSNTFDSLLTWSAFFDSNGIILYPLWAPRKLIPWVSGVKFGARVERVYALGAHDYNTPSIPDAPRFTLSFVNASGVTVSLTLIGYPLNVNFSDPSHYAPEIRRGKTVFRGNNTGFTGDAWNLTYWCGSWKLGPTIAISGVCIQVTKPDLKGIPVSFPGQPVSVLAIGATGVQTIVDSGSTDNDGVYYVKWKLVGSMILPNSSAIPIAEAPVLYAFGELNATPVRILYIANTTLNLDSIVSPYGIKTKDISVPETMLLNFTLYFSSDVGRGGKCITLAWSGIFVTVFSWAGQPVENMFVTLTPTINTAYPSTFGFTDSNGTIVLVVAPNSGREYWLDVYWRDSYILQKIGAIPKMVNIYSSAADQENPRKFKAGDGTTVEVYVYSGVGTLTDLQGEVLPSDILDKLTVYVTWPDGVVTKHKVMPGDTFSIELNPQTVVSWPHPQSQFRSPNSPPDHPQTPSGAYLFKVVHSELGTLCEVYGKIEKGRVNTPLIKLAVPVPYRSFTILVESSLGEPLGSAEVEYFARGMLSPATGITNGTGHFETVKLLPQENRYTLDYLRIVKWNGIGLGFEQRSVQLQPNGATVIVVSNLGKVEVEVVGARDQALESVSVKVSQIPSIMKSTDKAGRCDFMLPEGIYTITVERSGRRAETTVSVKGGERVPVKVKLDIWLTLFGVDLSFSEAVGLLLAICLLIVALTIVLYEYHAYRTRSFVKVIASPAKTSEEKPTSGRSRFFWFTKKKKGGES